MAHEYIDFGIREIRQYFMKPELQVVMENVGLEGEVYDHFDGRILNPGHAIEASWFVMHEGRLRNDNDLITMGASMLDWMWERGWDKQYGGILYFRDLKNLPVQEYWQDMKFWWPQNDAIVATLLAFALTKNTKYETGTTRSTVGPTSASRTLNTVSGSDTCTATDASLRRSRGTSGKGDSTSRGCSFCAGRSSSRWAHNRPNGPRAVSSRWDDNSLDDLKMWDVLARYNCKATWYLNDPYASPEFTSISSRLLEGGNSIGGHSLTHAMLSYVNRNQMFRELALSRARWEAVSDACVMSLRLFFRRTQK